MQNTDKIEYGPRANDMKKYILHKLIQQRIQQPTEAENNRKLQE